MFKRKGPAAAAVASAAVAAAGGCIFLLCAGLCRHVCAGAPAQAYLHRHGFAGVFVRRPTINEVIVSPQLWPATPTQQTPDETNKKQRCKQTKTRRMHKLVQVKPALVRNFVSYALIDKLGA